MDVGDGGGRALLELRQLRLDVVDVVRVANIAVQILDAVSFADEVRVESIRSDVEEEDVFWDEAVALVGFLPPDPRPE